MLFQHRQRYKGSKVAENAEDKAKRLQLNGDRRKRRLQFILEPLKSERSYKWQRQVQSTKPSSTWHLF